MDFWNQNDSETSHYDTESGMILRSEINSFIMSLMNIFIIASDRVFNQQGSHKNTEKVLALAEKNNLSIHTLEIVNLAKRWADKLKPNEFKSGASAMDAVNKARKLIASGKADVVVIKGEDLLKTGYAKADRDNFMKLYNKKYTPMDGYNKLVPAFLRHHGFSEKDYFQGRDALFENYFKTCKELHPDAQAPEGRWFQPLTKYFRGVDCANPHIDYSAQIVITNKNIADKLKVPAKARVQILGNAFTKLAVDGFASIPKIAPYTHLKKTLNKALKEAKIDFNLQFLDGHAALDAYTCYPVVPMGLLVQMGLIEELQDLPNFLKEYEVTVTGGLNLGKAAWNLTSLNAIIAMREKLIHSKNVRYGMVHGNGSLGNQQGITILGK